MDFSKLCMGCMSERVDDSQTCSNCGWVHDAPTDTSIYLKPGTVINNYVFGKVLGHGGFGITYLGMNITTNEVVAIKEYFPSGNITRSESNQALSVFRGKEQEYDYGLQKFRQEADMLQKFNEFPGIVDGKEYFEFNNTGYFVMEYIEGVTLKDYVAQKGGSIPFRSVKAILMPMMDSLEEMHKQKIIHRDISPDNIYITKDKRVKLLDFGAARQAIGEKNKSLSIILKHGFAPKEQYYTRGNQGPWTDVYALAATAYYMLTGQTPQASLERVEKDEIIMPSRLGADIGFEEEKVLMTAMSLKENERYQTMRNFQTALARAEQHSNNQGNPQSMPPQMPPQGQQSQGQSMGQPSGQIYQQPQGQSMGQPSGQMYQQPQGQSMGQPSGQMYQQPQGQSMGQPSGQMYQQPQGQSMGQPSGQMYQQPQGTPAQPAKKKSKTPVIIISLLLVLLLIGGGVTTLLLMLGNRAQMPNIQGMTLDEAEEAFNDLGLSYRIDDSSEYDEDVDKGEIISQDPKRGETVKKNERINIEIVVSDGPPIIEFPDFASMSEDKAKEDIEELGFEVTVTYEYSDYVAEDDVISQSPSAGTELEPESESDVSLVISMGPKPVVNIEVADSGAKDSIMSELGLSGSEITDADIENVTYLDLSYSDIADLSGLENFVNLETLNLTGNSVTDISPLASLTNLTTLYLDYNSIEIIEALPPNIEYITMKVNQIDTLPDLTVYNSLWYIDVYDNYLGYLPIVPSSAKTVNFGFNIFEDVSNLDYYYNVTNLNISENLIEDISPISYCTSLTSLDISNNKISDFSAISYIYDNLTYYNDDGNYGSYAGGSTTSGYDYAGINEQFSDLDSISWELCWMEYDDLDNPDSYYYIGDLTYVGEYTINGDAMTYYDSDNPDYYIGIFFDSTGYSQGYYLEYDGLAADNYMGYYYAWDLVAEIGQPYVDTGDELVYVTDSFIYEIKYDDYGVLTDGFAVLYRTDSRLDYY